MSSTPTPRCATARGLPQAGRRSSLRTPTRRFAPAPGGPQLKLSSAPHGASPELAAAGAELSAAQRRRPSAVGPAAPARRRGRSTAAPRRPAADGVGQHRHAGHNDTSLLPRGPQLELSSTPPRAAPPLPRWPQLRGLDVVHGAIRLRLDAELAARKSLLQHHLPPAGKEGCGWGAWLGVSWLGCAVRGRLD